MKTEKCLSDLECLAYEVLADTLAYGVDVDVKTATVTPDSWSYCCQQRALVEPEQRFEFWITDKDGTTLEWTAGGRNCTCELLKQSWSYELSQCDDESIDSFCKNASEALNQMLETLRNQYPEGTPCCSNSKQLDAPLAEP